MRRVLISILLAATSIPALAEEPVDPAIAAAELRKKIADAEAAEADAEKAKYEKQKAAAEAKFGFLPKSPAEGKATIGEGGGVLETEFLVADALAAAADYIVKDLGTERSNILLVEGPQSQGNVRLLSFEAEIYGLKKSSQRALGLSQDVCAPHTRTTYSATAEVAGAPFVAGAFIGALGDLLKTDTTITGKTSGMTEAQLIRALLVRAPAERFRTTYLDTESLNSDNSVIQKVDCISRYQQDIDAALAAFDTEEKKKANAAKIARLNSAAGGIDSLFDRLLKVDKDSPSLLGLLYADSEIGAKSGSVLRVWVDANGGTFINRRNLWTTFGARALSMTGGAVISYALIDRPDTKVVRAGFLKCTTDLVSLRRAQQRNLILGACTPLARPPSAPKPATG